MKFRKRTRPADFGAPQSGTLPGSVAEAQAEPHGPQPWEHGHDAPPLADAYDLHPEPYAPPRPPPWQSPVTAAHPHVPVPRHEPDETLDAEAWKAPSAWPVYLTAFAVAVLWAAGPIAFAIGYRNAVVPFRNDMFALGVFALLAA